MISNRARQLWALVGFARLRTLSLVTFSHGFVAIAFFMQTILLARILPLAEFGQVATLVATATVIEAAVGARGNETALAAFTQLVPHDLTGRAALIRLLLRIDLIWSASIYAILTVALLVVGTAVGPHKWWLAVLMAGSFAAFPWGTTKSYLTVYCRPSAFPPIEMTYAAITLLVGVGLSLVIGGLGFIIGTALASLARSILGFRQARLSPRMIIERSEEELPTVSRSIWLFGVTGTLRSGVLNFASQMDILLLSAVSGPAAVGLYRAAKTLSGVVQRLAQPMWFVLKRHVIVGTLDADLMAHSRKVVILASLGFAGIGVVAIPPMVYFSEQIAAFVFGEQYRGAAQAIVWLVPGAWIFYAMTGWSSLFGSVAKSRKTVISIYLLQVVLFAAIAYGMGVTHRSVALAMALSQVLVAASFWYLLLRPAHRPETSAV